MKRRVILLIYEYAIAVESSLVQIKRGLNSNKTNETNDNPVADRLDRSYFGFDQDYYERMPLLVNAMQENSYVDPAIEIATSKNRARFLITNFTKPTVTTTADNRYASIRRTSPRPFIFEYRSPTPTPFSKTYGSRSWVESYRNAQRLRNLQQVIQYLEKTINAKFGDMYALPTSTHIAFSGVYVEPMAKNLKEVKPTVPTGDLLIQSSNRFETVKSNHQSDPLFSFKPESPGDVNLLADGFFRFSPVSTSTLIKEKPSHIPMFRSISKRKRHCIGIKCNENNISKTHNPLNIGEIRYSELTSTEKPNSFSVLLNLFPLNPTNTDYKKLNTLESTQSTVNQIYLTTTRPTVQFRRRSTTPIRRTTTIYKRPRFLPDKKQHKSLNENRNYRENKRDTEPRMVVHVNVYPPVKVQNTDQTETVPSTTQASNRGYVTVMPVLTSTQVEDFHVGSSGIIPVESRLTPAPPPPISTSTIIPTVTTIIPFLDTTYSSADSNIWPTKPTDVIKFSHEDAKVPDHYKEMFKEDDIKNKIHPKNGHSQPEINRRNSNEHIKIKDDYIDVEPKTLIVKLKNEIETTTKDSQIETKTEEVKETTTAKTYVPQINGHYRSVNQNSRHINSWLDDNIENNRKKRLEMSVTGFRKPTYVPQYVQIKRNNTRNTSDDNQSDS